MEGNEWNQVTWNIHEFLFVPKYTSRDEIYAIIYVEDILCVVAQAARER